jgi:hypothetical protein
MNHPAKGWFFFYPIQLKYVQACSLKNHRKQGFEPNEQNITFTSKCTVYQPA